MKSFLVLLAASALLAGCDSRPTSSTLDGTDGFGDNTFSYYVVVADSGNGWSIGNGQLVGTGPARNSLLMWSANVMTNGYIETESTRADDGGLVLRLLDDANFYLLTFSDDGAPGTHGQHNLTVIRRVSGVDTQLLDKDVTWPRGTNHVVRFQAQGSKLSVFFDGALQGEVTDNLLTNSGGYFGLRHSGPDGSWRSIFDVFRWHLQQI